MNTKSRILIIFSIVLSMVLSTTQIKAYTPTVTPSTVSSEKTTLHFIVYYSGDLSAVMNDKDSYIKTFMDVYHLKLVSTFKIDEENGGFTLEATEELDFPTEVAKEISLIDNVLMIEVAYVPVTAES